MKLREWRLLKGYPLWKVAELMGRKSESIVSNWESRGVSNYRLQEELRKISKNQITDFSRSAHFQCITPPEEKE